MLSHSKIWAAIDALALRYDMTPSGLARRAGLDPTAFNKSKRFSPDGRMRWPSTESISKILEATHTPFEDFTAMASDNPAQTPLPQPKNVPLLGMAQAGAGGFFDDGGFPVGHGWDEVRFPNANDEEVYALEVSGNSMLPLYREGDIILVSPNGECRRGDRVVVRTIEGEVMAKVLVRRTTKNIELESLNPEHNNLKFDLKDIDWIARIIWASQ
jgi:phage repressor protein C with HTH and peptisase S24 domain